MIFLEMSGGLGNQIFQYCAGRLFQSFKGDSVTYHYTAKTASNHDNREIAIDKFCIDSGWKRMPDNETIFAKHKFHHFIYRAYVSLTVRLFGNLPTVGEKQKWFFKLLWNVLNRFGIYIQRADYCFPIKKSWSKNIFVIGMWQTPSYFEDILPVIKNELQLKSGEIFPEAQALIENMHNTNSVCVHVRRGDYIRIPGYHVCTNDYYKRAFEKIRSMTNEPVFYFFSDDIDWVKDNLVVDGCECHYIDDKNKDYIDFEIMRNAKHFILSNSTYSFWVSTLGTDPQKIVCAPDRWFADERGKAIYLDSWLLIPTK